MIQREPDSSHPAVPDGANFDLPPLDPERWRQTRGNLLLSYFPRAEQAKELPFTPLEAMPEQLADFNDINSFLQDFQHQHGVEPDPLSPDNVHTASPENIARALELIKPGEKGGAFWEWFTRIAYVPQIEQDDPFDRRHYAATLAHELSHAITPGLGVMETDYSLESHALREGMADVLARRFLRQVFMPAHLPGELDRIEATFSPGGELASVQPRTREGHLFTPDDVFYLHPEQRGLMMPFEYLPEGKLVERVERLLGDEHRQELWRQAMTNGGDPIGFVRATLGSQQLKWLVRWAYHPPVEES